MQLHIDGIKECHSYEDLYSYFIKYGHIKSLKIIDTYGFITFESYEDALKVLKEKHTLNNSSLYVEEARQDRPEPVRRVDDRLRMSRDPYERYDRYGPPIPPPYDRYERYERPAYDRYVYDRYEREPLYERRRPMCSYCDRCPEHGIPRERNLGHPKDKLKIVLMGVPESVTLKDVKDFVNSHEMDACYIRITKNKRYAIVEFNSLEEKDEALLKLDNKDFMGCNIQVREFKSNTDEKMPRKRFRDNDNDGERREEKLFKENNEEKEGVYEDIQERPEE